MRRANELRQKRSEGLSARGSIGKLFCPAAACPNCGARPAVRVTADAVEDALRHPPDTPLSTYRCQRRGCGQIYDLTAGAYQDAL